MLEKELETAIALARGAGKIILDLYGTDFVAEEKVGADDYSEPVTIADTRASRMIVDGLAAVFPNDAILSEEEADDVEPRLANARVWIVDPLDGTAGFVRRDGDFGVQIGLAADGVPVLGVVYLPFHDRLTYAVKGAGSFAIQGTGEAVRLTTSDIPALGEMKLAMSRNHPSPRMGRIIEHFGFRGIVNRGSVGLKVGLIADRTCDIYIHPSPRTKLWDTCAPHIILEEAGGRFTDLFGAEMTYRRADLQNRNGILASNGAAHDAVVGHLKPLLDEFGRVPYKVI
jgi:3'(2'), 5'-bisphosphate nucleotidase